MARSAPSRWPAARRPISSACASPRPTSIRGSGGVENTSTDPGAARRAIRTVLLPYYNARFQLAFTDAELDDLTEFLLSM